MFFYRNSITYSQPIVFNTKISLIVPEMATSKFCLWNMGVDKGREGSSTYLPCQNTYFPTPSLFFKEPRAKELGN